MFHMRNENIVDPKLEGFNSHNKKLGGIDYVKRNELSRNNGNKWWF